MKGRAQAIVAARGEADAADRGTRDFVCTLWKGREGMRIFVSDGWLIFHRAFMDRNVILARLKSAEAALRARGVSHAALFGSIVRGEAKPTSDIDILVDLDPAIVRTMFDYAGVKDYIADLFDVPVDVVDREGLKPDVRPSATAEAVYAF